MVRQSRTTVTAPAINNEAVMPSAHQGCATARDTTVITPTSSVVLTMALLNGSGDVLTASRTPALTPCEARAVLPPRAVSMAWSAPEESPVSCHATHAPTVGRTMVETPS